MAISERIRAEARRTIDGMQRFYEKFSDDPADAEELEHRIARVEASMEGCNGLTPDEKIQKTAENVFELTCAQERTYDAIRREIKEVRKQNDANFKSLQEELKTGLECVVKKIEDSGSDSSVSVKNYKTPRFLTKFISDHPLLTFNAFMFIVLLVFISGHFEIITGLIGSLPK